MKTINNWNYKLRMFNLHTLGPSKTERSFDAISPLADASNQVTNTYDEVPRSDVVPQEKAQQMQSEKSTELHSRQCLEKDNCMWSYKTIQRK